MKLIGAPGNRLSSKLESIALTLVFALAALAGSPKLWSQTTYPGQIGTEVSDQPTGFVDAFANQGRPMMDANGNNLPTDANGNPLSDGIQVVFDDRPTWAWGPPIDDPAQYQTNLSGTYTMSFTGQAILSSVEGDPTVTFSNQVYNEATNTTTVNVTMPGGPTFADGPALMVINFTSTQLTPTSGVDTGIANLHVIRPGMTASQVFDPAFVNAFGPFAYMRFMGWLNTNQNPGTFSNTAPTALLLNWSNRSLPTDYFQGIGSYCCAAPFTNIKSGAWGVSWEYVILLANATNKDAWINIPVTATGSSDSKDPTYVASPDTSSYIYNLAMLFKNGDAFTGNVGLNPGLHIYIEHSNEVWNSGFNQYAWNVAAATYEKNLGGSVLNNDGNNSSSTWAIRRHIKRVYEIAQIFESVFGPGSFGAIIRPVFAWQEGAEGSGSAAAGALAWFNTTYGPPANYFYGMAMGDYFVNSHYTTDTTIALQLSDLSSSSTAQVSSVTSSVATANTYGIPLLVYEGGPNSCNNNAQSTVNVGVEVLSNRDPGIAPLVQTHIRNNYFAYTKAAGTTPGSLFGYFVMSSAFSRYGSWGAAWDYSNLCAAAKYNALVNLTGYTVNGVPFCPGDLVATAGNASVALSWLSVPGATSYNVKRGTISGGEALVTNVSSTSYTDSPVTNGNTYYYVVTGDNSTGESTPSNEVSVTPMATPPAAPTLSGYAGNATVNLNWTASEGAVTYSVYQGTTPGGESATPIVSGVVLPVTNYIVQSLTNGITYYYKVAAVNSIGTGPLSNEIGLAPVGPPPAPVLNTATAGNAVVTLSWSASYGATSYIVYEGASSTAITNVLASGVTLTSYIATGMPNSRVYFAIAAVNALGTSAQSNSKNATPAATAPTPPTNLQATAGNTQVKLTWTDSSSGSPTSYQVWYNWPGGTLTEPTSTLASTATSYTVTGLTNGVPYTLYAVAFNSHGSTPSSTVTATPVAPQAITFTAPASPVTYGVSPITLVATGGASGNPVTFSIVSGPGSLSGVNNSVLAITGVGTVVVAANQAASAAFTAAPQVTQSIVVNKALLTVTANNTSMAVGAALPTFTASYSGFVNGDGTGVLSGSPSLTTTATSSSPAGTYPITAALGTLSAANYSFVFVNGTLSIVAAPTVVITTSATLSGSHSTGYTASITVKNSGTGAASNVVLSTATLSSASGTPLPQGPVSIAAGGSTTFTVSFSGSAGTDGAGVAEKYSGTYTGGSFSASVRSVTLP